MRTNIKNFSYQNSSVEEFFTDKYNLEFNYKVKQQIETMCPKMLPNSRKLGFVKVDTSKYRSPIRITSLQFFNLFYHEIDFIKENKSNPLSIIPRLQSILLLYFDKLFLYSKLIEILLIENNKQLLFIAKLIEEEYNLLYDKYLQNNNQAKNTAEEIINFHNTLIDSTGSIKEVIMELLEWKDLRIPFHYDPDINSYIRETWLYPQIEYYQNLFKNGIQEKPVIISPDLQYIRDIISDTITTEPIQEKNTYYSETNHNIKKPISKTVNLKEHLANYEFFELPMIKELSVSGQIRLLELLSVNGMPYCIAMFEHINFIKHLSNKYFTAKHKMYKEMSIWFESDNNGRAVKGNINSLSPNSKESKTRYTAYLHKEQVKRDYQNLK